MRTLRRVVIFAVGLVAAAAAGRDDAAQLAARANALFERGDPAAASELYERAVALAPKSAAYHYALARSMTAEAKRSSNAVRLVAIGWAVGEELEAAVRLDPSNDDARLDLIRYCVMAPRILGGSAAKAHAQSVELARRNPSLGAFASGYMAYREKRYDDARGKLRESVKLARTTSVKVLALTWLGYLSQETQQYDEAFESFETILALDPSHAAALYELGRTSGFSGQRVERGEEALRAYLATKPKIDDPTLAEAHFRLGKLYERVGRTDDAAREIALARNLDKDVK